LSNVALNYTPMSFFADKVAPIVNVQKQSDLVPIWSQSDIWRVDNAVRAPGNEANRVEISVSSVSYFAKNYALRTDITVEDRANADAFAIRQLETGRTNILSWKLKNGWDSRVGTQVSNTANVGTSANVGSSWTDLSNSDPYSDILTIRDQIEDGTGFKPNRMLIGGEAFRYLARNNNIIDKTKATALTGASMNASKQQIAELFELDEIIVGGGYYNSAEEGQPMSLTRTFQPHVLLYYAPSAPSIEMPSFMYTFRWNVPGVPSMQAERLPFNRDRHSEGIEVGYYQDEKIVSADLGGLVANVTSSQ